MTKSDKSKGPTRDTKLRDSIAAVFGLIGEIYAYGREQAAQPDNKSANDKALVRASWVTAGATAFIAIAGALTFGAAMLQWNALSKTVGVMQGQLESMERDQRTWLKSEFQILRPLAFDKDGLQLALSAKTFNIGKSPAFDAQLNPLIVTTGVDAIKIQKEFCEKLRSQSSYTRGVVIFPGSSITNTTTRGFSWDEIERGKTMPRYVPTFQRNQLLGIVLTGCITYMLASQTEGRHYETGFGYFLRQTKTEIRGLEANQGATIPLQDISYETWPDLTWAD